PRRPNYGKTEGGDDDTHGHIRIRALTGYRVGRKSAFFFEVGGHRNFPSSYCGKSTNSRAKNPVSSGTCRVCVSGCTSTICVLGFGSATARRLKTQAVFGPLRIVN